jgi:hypothetical protein
VFQQDAGANVAPQTRLHDDAKTRGQNRSSRAKQKLAGKTGLNNDRAENLAVMDMTANSDGQLLKRANGSIGQLDLFQ